MEVAIPVGNLKVTAVGNLDVGTYFYALGGQYDLAGLGVVLHGPNSQKAYVMLNGDQPFRLKKMGGGGERRNVVALDAHEIVFKFATDQVGDADPYAIGAAVVSGAGVDIVVQLDGAGGTSNVFACRLGDYTVNNETPGGDLVSLKQWKLIARDVRGNDVTLFETA